MARRRLISDMEGRRLADLNPPIRLFDLEPPTRLVDLERPIRLVDLDRLVRTGTNSHARRDNYRRRHTLCSNDDDANGYVAIGEGNSAGRDSEMDVVDNVVRGINKIRLGAGNSAGRDNRIVISGNIFLCQNP